MSRKRRMFFKAAQRDQSEPAIIKALEAAGATVWQLSGKDIPDLLVGYKGQTFLLEAKTRGLEYTDKRNGKTYRRDGALREGQKEFFASWTGGPAREVFTPEEALMAIGAVAEGVMEPLTIKRLYEAMDVAVARHLDVLLPVHPESLVGEAIRAEVETKGHVDVEPDQIVGHVVTPAYQKAQTEAVVPPRRTPEEAWRAPIRDLLHPEQQKVYDSLHKPRARKAQDPVVKPETYDSVFGPASEPPKKRRKS